MTEPAALADQLGPRQRVVVLVVGVVLVVHSVLLALWLAPSSPVRDVIGDARLASYVDPYFQQGDETVGFGSNRVDEALQLRAYVRPEGGGSPIFTEWVDVTAREARAVRGELDPPRARQIARRVATNLNFALFGLTPGQREIVADLSADVSPLRLQQQLLAADQASTGDVANVVAQDQMATQFASLWLGAELPAKELLQVQYRVGRRVVPAFGDVASVQGITFDWFNIGWRAAFRGDPAARATFADYVGGGPS